jgi:alpha-tubulin suppressor-like RCC1 family protein
MATICDKMEQVLKVKCSPSDLFAVGNGQYGRLGDNVDTVHNVLIPYRVNKEHESNGDLPAGKKIVAVSATNEFTLMIDEDGYGYGMGQGLSGVLADGNINVHSVPVPIRINKDDSANGDLPAGKKIIAVAVGSMHSLIIDEDGNGYSFGLGSDGRLGDNNTDYHSVSTPFRFTLIDRNNGDLPANKKLRAIVASYTSSMVIDEDGNAYTFGKGQYGKLGNNDVSNSGTLYRINKAGTTNGDLPAGKKIIAVSQGQYHSLIIDEDGYGYSFGAGDYGKLGDNDTTSHNVLVPYLINKENAANGDLPAGTKLVSVSAAYFHTLILDKAGNSYSFGSQDNGKFGNGQTTGYLGTPFRINKANDINGDIPAGTKIAFILATDSHSFIIDTDGKAYSFGLSANGRLGDSSDSIRAVSTPYRVNRDTQPDLNLQAQIISISSRLTFSMFLKNITPYSCFDIDWKSSSVCNGKGHCTEHDRCCCQKGYAGHECKRVKSDDPYYYERCFK